MTPLPVLVCRFFLRKRDLFATTKQVQLSVQPNIASLLISGSSMAAVIFSGFVCIYKKIN